jgi:endonuclease/exonuclease/phosphatase family metal-dependent hydrolase
MMRTACRNLLFGIALLLLAGCHTVRRASVPAGPHFRVLTYNVNWGMPRPDLAAEIIRNSGAEIICLQETTPEWEAQLRAALSREYPYMEFRESQGRMGGGLGFLSKVPQSEVAYIPSDTGWFDGWIREFETSIGPVQILNVHLHPPVGKRGGWTLGGYLFTGKDRLREMRRFCPARKPRLRMLVVGDFNDTQNCATIKWLKRQGMTNALPQFDRHSDTWKWKIGLIRLHRRMDHMLYSPELNCCTAEVIHAGASDHFPVAATFETDRR